MQRSSLSWAQQPSRGWAAPSLQRGGRSPSSWSTMSRCKLAGGYYFRAAFTGSLTFSTVANSIFQSSPFTFSTLRR
jgi:hypothetical protein